jgi:ribonuclease G
MARDNLIIVNVDLGETRVALVENGIIVELLVERDADRSLVGNVYRGRVVRVLPGMQAAFLDVGLERHAFLHVSDIVSPDDPGGGEEAGPDADAEPDADADEPDKARRITRRTPIRDVIKEGEAIAVQIAKDPIGTKGCRVTADVSLAGRHLVYMPYSERGGVSRRITDEAERKRLAKVLKRIAPPKGALIARTVAEGASADSLEADACYLVDTWNEIRTRNKAAKKPCLLYEELSLPLRAARDSLNDSVAEMVVDDAATAEKLRGFVDRLMPNRLDSIRRYEGAEPIFDAFGIESEIKRALERVVELPSGGSLVIDQGEALTAIDVNTGKFVGKGSRDQEETIFRTNLEAVDEIAYQVRFRNIGGLIVLDLIDMDRPANRREVLNRLQKALKDDRAKTSVSPISRFGLLEMTRERTRESLGRQLHEKCSHCDGTGHTLSRVTLAHEVLREVQRRHDEISGPEIEVRLHPHVAEVFKGEGARPLKELEKRIARRVVLKPEGGGHIEEYHVRARRGGGGKEGS